MVTLLLERLSDRTATFVRVSVLLVLVAGYHALLAGPADRPGIVGWLILLAAVGVSTVSARWPLAYTLGQTSLLAVAELVGDGALVPLKVLASFALFELAMRTTGWRLPAGTAALSALYLVLGFTHAGADLLEVAYKTAVVVGGPVVLGAYIRSVRSRARLAEERAAEQERLRRSEAHVARVAERTAIARELHDLIAHHVASIVLRVGVARHLDEDRGDGADAGTRQVLDDVHETGTAALADLRRLVALLRDPVAPDSPSGALVDPAELPAALAAVVARGRQVGLRIDAVVDPALTGLDAVRGLAVLRLAQEGLTNVAKHAGPAACVRLSAELADGGVRIEVTDDGGGARPGLHRFGHGLTGLRERVELLGGTLHAGPHGAGWRLSALLPTTQPATRFAAGLAQEAPPVGSLP